MYIVRAFAEHDHAVVLHDENPAVWLGNDADGLQVAVRWTLQGTHEGNGVFGEPTGARIKLVGITHYDVKDSKFVKEWTCFDQFAVLKQIYAFQMETGTLDIEVRDT